MPNRGTIFLIDEDPVFSAIAAALFSASGAWNVETVGNTEAAIDDLVMRSSQRDIVVLGLNMSGLDGLAILRLLSGRKFRGFVVISSDESVLIREAAVRLAGLLHLRTLGELEKPVNEADIRAILVKAAAFEAEAERPLPVMLGTNGHVQPVYQPKFNSISGEVVGGEALMRLKTADGMLLSPFEHIEKVLLEGRLAEETLLFLDLVLDDLSAFRKAGHFPVISVNVPAPVAEEASFPASFAAKVRAKGISPSQITVELTESALPAEPARLVEVLTRLRMAGFGLALDDFGTGMANFDMLRMLPFNELKIDRSLAQSAENDPLSCGIIETCATISRELGMTLVAEGVETEGQELTLKRLGVSVFQGFLFGKGVPADQFLALLACSSD